MKIEVIESNAEAIICGETYDVIVLSGPNEDGLCKIEVLFDNGNFTETMAISRDNIFPRIERKEIQMQQHMH